MISQKEFITRKKNKKPFNVKVKGGWLARYARMVSSADTGATVS